MWRVINDHGGGGGGSTLLWHVLGHVLLKAEQTTKRFRDFLIVQDFVAQLFTSDSKILKKTLKTA
jgi:hypothetical protein